MERLQVDPQQPAVRVSPVSRPRLRVAYVFAGHRRRADVRAHLEALAEKHGFELDMHEFDLVRGEDQDVLDESFWCELLRFLRDFRPFCIIATPPCSTYSRARHLYKRIPGPRPIRSREHPDGFPWLTAKKLQQAAQGTAFANKTWELADLAYELDAAFLSEFPEDLGKMDTGVPASLWQMQKFSDCLARKNMKTFALFQCEFGAQTPKPTRFLSDLDHFIGNFYLGAPEFYDDWSYKGPLPRVCPHPGAHQPLIGTDHEGKWKTGPAAHYPGPLCNFLATAIYLSWADSSSASGGRPSAEPSARQLSSEPVEKQLTPEQTPEQVKIQSGCNGPPMRATYAGRSEEFCDGMGLCSPGRWHPSLRQSDKTGAQSEYCGKLASLIDKFCVSKLGDLSKATMRLALGRFESSPFTEADLDELRKEWFKLLPNPVEASTVPPDQPFFLHAVAQSLRLMGDPDVDIIDCKGESSYASGVHLGHLSPLGPTPQVYRPRSKEPSYDESDWSLNMDNYFRGSEEAERILAEQFKEEESAGRMKPLSEKEAQKMYPGNALRIAAQGILDKPDGGHRIIHDGTHGVHLNNEIRIEDRLENPGPRELACIMETSEAADERVIFAINADIAKAHRRVLVRPSD